MTLAPQREPSPTAAWISGPVSPVTMPISVMPASTMSSMPKNRMGLFATGTSCLALVWVIGRRRVPAPPERMSPFTASFLAGAASQHPFCSPRTRQPDGLAEVSDGPAAEEHIPARAGALDAVNADCRRRCSRWERERIAVGRTVERHGPCKVRTIAIRSYGMPDAIYIDMNGNRGSGIWVKHPS